MNEWASKNRSHKSSKMFNLKASSMSQTFQTTCVVHSIWNATYLHHNQGLKQDRLVSSVLCLRKNNKEAWLRYRINGAETFIQRLRLRDLPVRSNPLNGDSPELGVSSSTGPSIITDDGKWGFSSSCGSRNADWEMVGPTVASKRFRCCSAAGQVISSKVSRISYIA